jgi:glycerate 2-kinase
MDRVTVRAAFDAAISACDPEVAVRRALDARKGHCIVAGTDLGPVPPRGVVVVAIGKAAAGMARGVASAGFVVRGLAVTDHIESCPVEVFVSDHPIPGGRSATAGRMLMELVGSTGPDDIVLYLVSGGGSALAEVPRGGIGMDDLVTVNRTLLASGIPIDDINEVRSALSDIKAGRLAAASRSGAEATLVAVDVPSGSLDHVASGPSIASSLGAGAMGVVTAYELGAVLPGSVMSVLASEPPSPVHPRGPVVEVLSPRAAGAAAIAELEQAGSMVGTLRELVGSTPEAVEGFVTGVQPDEARVAVGETSLVVGGCGIGGRNQHAALVAGLLVEGTDVVFGAFGTDGVDGGSSAAGAIVDGCSVGRMRAAGVDPLRALEDFDSSAALAASGDLVITGPTGTNVADLWVVGRTGGRTIRNRGLR